VTIFRNTFFQQGIASSSGPAYAAHLQLSERSAAEFAFNKTSQVSHLWHFKTTSSRVLSNIDECMHRSIIGN